MLDIITKSEEGGREIIHERGTRELSWKMNRAQPSSPGPERLLLKSPTECVCVCAGSPFKLGGPCRSVALSRSVVFVLVLV